MLEEKAEFPVSLMARVLEVSRSGFYSWLASGRPRDGWSAERDAVMRVWLESDRRFGFRFVHAMPPPGFRRLTRYRVLKLMRELGIRGCTPNARKRTTIPDPNAKPRPDLVRRDFTSPVPTCKLVGDITYLRTGRGWLFLATVIDLCTRMVVGWSLSDRMTADIAVAALESAKSRGYVAGNAIFHSDRGAQYTSRLLAEWARDNDVRLSCGRTGSCHDNAVAESFFATLKSSSTRGGPRRVHGRARRVHGVLLRGADQGVPGLDEPERVPQEPGLCLMIGPGNCQHPQQYFFVVLGEINGLGKCQLGFFRNRINCDKHHCWCNLRRGCRIQDRNKENDN